ncbi:Uncharacterized protein APZ42_023257 [Daphnia magna]|uniref:Uncharacterized protein n=1 Tax=Daphnia magna TaxID=35525 RepID=A0A164V3H8_9CRUS|nr:Uncharacterized protein APZ42_023257 [Daphnia magna]
MLLVGHMTLSGNVSVLRKMSSLVMKGVLIPSDLYCVTSARSDCSRWKKLVASVVAGNEISLPVVPVTLKLKIKLRQKLTGINE